MNVRDVPYFDKLFKELDLYYPSFTLIVEHRDVPFTQDYTYFLRIYVNKKYITECSARFETRTVRQIINLINYKLNVLK